MPPAKPRFFPTPEAFRSWLAKHHQRARELVVGFYKVGSGTPSITWPQAVDQALCFGWIDGVRRSLGATSYTIRFTPRRPRSIWSAANTRRFAALEKQGLVAPAGRAAFHKREAKRSGVYSFEQRKRIRLPPAQRKALQKNAKAWAFFRAQAPWYQRTTTWWVVSAKKEATRDRRLQALIADSAAGRTIGPLTRSTPRKG